MAGSTTLSIERFFLADFAIFTSPRIAIVVCVTMAVAISTAVASNLDGVSGVGGVIGAAISGSFLILVALINSFILVKSYRRIQREKKEEFNIDSRKKDLSNFKPDSQASEDQTNSHRFSGILTRIALPLLKLVNRPWHLYPIGVLFGFGFDTASSITLLSVATVATRTNSTEEMVESSNQSAPQVILLALLFTAGMSLVDSLDSVMMIYGYAQKRDGELENWWDWFEKKEKDQVGNLEGKKDLKINDEEKEKDVTLTSEDQVNQLENQGPKLLISTSTFSSLSLLLTLLSILLAFAIGSIVLLGLIGDECSRCSRAADKQEENGNGGLEGKWWLAWRRANDESGKVGAGIVGVFALILLGYVGGRWGLRKWSARRKEK